jgi:hypothetical protein
LPEDASMSDLVMLCTQLAEYLSGGLPEEPGGDDVGPKGLTIGQLNLGTQHGGNPDEIAQMVRDYLAEWLGQGKKVPEEAPGPEASPSAASSGKASASGSGARAETQRALPTGARVEEVRIEAPGAEVRG